MSKVIVERPRIKERGSAKGRRQEFYDDWENSPQRESMGFRHRGNSKSLNENLAPLRRFLLKSVGRPWNKVYSEICENINVTNTVQNHIRQHLPDFVALHVVLVDKKPFERGRWGLMQIHEPCYVHPVTGILCKSPKPSYPYKPLAKKFQRIRIDEYHSYVRIDDCWFLVEFKPIVRLWSDVGMYPHDAVFKHSNGREYTQEWGSQIYASSKRSLNKKKLKEIRHLMVRS